MAHSDAGNYKAKHPSNVKLDDKIAQAVKKKIIDGTIACADAEIIADSLHTTMQDVGVAADLMEIRISKCQLGLFGYSPEKTIIKPADNVSEELERSIRNALANKRLPCAAAWHIAEKFTISKMDVSSACEALKIKIKPCQLGAF